MIFLNDDSVEKVYDVPKEILLMPHGFLQNLFRDVQRNTKKRVLNKYKVINYSKYNGEENVFIQYRCYWHHDWYRGIKNINSEILELVRVNKAKLIFINHLEGQPLVSEDPNINLLEPLYNELSRLKLSPENIIYITANAIASKEHIKWCDENNIKNRMIVHGINTEALWPSIHLVGEGRVNEDTYEQHLDKLKNQKNLRHFIKAHRNDRHFRTIMAHHLWNKNLSNTLHSHHLEYARNNVGYPPTQDVKTRKWLNLLLKTKDEFEKTLPHGIEYTCKRQEKKFNSETAFTKDIYELSLFNIYPTSWPFWKNTIFLRWGLFCHMWEYQPFIIYSNVNALKFIKERGYKTFPEIFDESYDSIEDDGLRLKVVCEEIERISRLPIEECFELYESVKDKLIYNRKQLEKNIELELLMEFLNEI